MRVLYRAYTATTTKNLMEHIACQLTLKAYTRHLDKLRDPTKNISEDNLSKNQTSTFQIKEA